VEPGAIAATAAPVPPWALTLGRHYLNQCLTYYRFGPQAGRVSLHSTLSAQVYSALAPHPQASNYASHRTLIDDFLQGFYLETLQAFRQEHQLPPTFQPRLMLELAEYMAFSDRYAQRKGSGTPLPLLLQRAKAFTQQQPSEVPLEMPLEMPLEVPLEVSLDTDSPSAAAAEDLDEAGFNEHAEETWDSKTWDSKTWDSKTWDREATADPDPLPAAVLRDRVVETLLAYLKTRHQEDCANYFTLRLLDISPTEIETLLNITPRQREYLQQRFRYHLIRFALSHHWQLVHDWLEADLYQNFGLKPLQWQQLQDHLSERQRQLLSLKQQGLEDHDIAQRLGLTPPQFQKQWSKLLEQAWEIRNL
jgi:hypothetical protein